MTTRVAPEERMERLRRRLRVTSEDDTTLRVMLVLAHEALRPSGPVQRMPDSEARPLAAALSAPVGPDDYALLVARIREVVSHCVPAGSSVLVVSRGDDDLLVSGFAAAHFPQGRNGAYAGFHPADSDSAVAHLEQLRQAGSEFLVLPATAYWWLDYYGGFAQHLLLAAQVAHHDEDCLIFDLRTQSEGELVA